MAAVQLANVVRRLGQSNAGGADRVTSVERGPERHRGRERRRSSCCISGRSGRETGPIPTKRSYSGRCTLRRTPGGVFASALVNGTRDHLETIDPLLEASADNWRLGRMAVIDRLIMRMAVYELLYTETPRAVVIDEALELAKTFGGDEAVAFINGVLDRVRRQVVDE